MKIDFVKVLGITGTILGMASTALSNIASEKQMAKEIEKQVAKALAEKITK